MVNINKLLEQAKQMQEDISRQMEDLELEELVLVAVNETVHAVDKELAGTLGGSMPPGSPPD